MPEWRWISEAVNSTTTKRIVVSIQNHDTLDFCALTT